MALEDTSVIDLVSKPNDEGKVCLIITDAGFTTDPEVRFDLLTKKCQAYVRAVLGGELELDHPGKKPGDFFIRVVCAHPPTEAMRQITSVGESDGQIPVFFEVWKSDAESEAPPPVAGQLPPIIGHSTNPPPLPLPSRPKKSFWIWLVVGLLLVGLAVAVFLGFWFVRWQRIQGQPSSGEAVEVGSSNGPSDASNAGAGTAPSLTPLPDGAVNDDLVILSAEFGTPGKRANVKARLVELLRTQPEGFEITGKSFKKDPAPYKKKSLTILYKYQGIDHALNLPGGQKMSAQTLVKNAKK